MARVSRPIACAASSAATAAWIAPRDRTSRSGAAPSGRTAAASRCTPHRPQLERPSKLRVRAARREALAAASKMISTETPSARGVTCTEQICPRLAIRSVRVKPKARSSRSAGVAISTACGLPS